MENPWNANFYGTGGEDDDYRRSMPGSSSFLIHQRSISEQNHLVNNGTAAKSDHMRGHRFISSGVPYCSISAPMWQQQIQPAADMSSADSHSRRKIPAITEGSKPRKREANRAHMGIGKKELETLQAKIGELQDENESLKQENAWQRKEYDDLKKKYEKQHECSQALEAENRRLKDKYIELLEKSNPLVVAGFGIHPNELGQQRVPPTSISRASACGSVTGNPANIF